MRRLQSAILVISILLFTECRKSNDKEILTNQSLIDSTRAFFEKEVEGKFMRDGSTDESVGISRTKKNPRYSKDRKPVWSDARVLNFSAGRAVVVPVHYKSPFLIRSNLGGKRLYSSNDLTKLLIYKKGKSQFRAEMVTFLPDSNNEKTKAGKFTGIAVIEDWAGNLLKQYKYDVSGKILKYRQPILSPKDTHRGSVDSRIVTICNEMSGYNYIADDPDNGYYWTQSMGCSIYYFANDLSEGGGGQWGGGDYGQIGIGSGGGGGGVIPSKSFTVVRGDNVISDISNYVKCFTNTPGNGHNFKITLCVDQPKKGSRSSWSFDGGSSSSSGNVVSVGHTFFILNETSSADNVVRNIGFYPESNVDPAAPVSQGQLNNDVYHDYDIALTITVTSSQFFQVLGFIEQGNIPGYLYDLNTNNCTTFALNALSAAGINLPRTGGSWLNGGGLNPGDLGEDIRNMALPSNMTRTELSGTHPNAGLCY